MTPTKLIKIKAKDIIGKFFMSADGDTVNYIKTTKINDEGNVDYVSFTFYNNRKPCVEDDGTGVFYFSSPRFDPLLTLSTFAGFFDDGTGEGLVTFYQEIPQSEYEIKLEEYLSQLRNYFH